MKKYCYVMVTSDGFDHWTRLVGQSTEATEKPTWEADNLSRLLQNGWRPVRESPMGVGNSSYAYSLILLEKD